MSLFGQTSNSGGLFGSNNSGGGLFGAANSSPSAASTTPGGGLFGNTKPLTSNVPPAATGGLFGSATNSNTPASGGLFGGATASAASNTTNSGGLFGTSTNSSTSAAGTSGGLFGASKPLTGGGLFGASTSAPSVGLFGTPTTTSTTSGGLFSTPAATSASMAFGAPAATSTGGGLFSAPTTTSTPQVGASLFTPGSTNSAPTSTGLFGNLNSSASNQATSNSLFGSQNQNPSPFLFGGSTQPVGGTGNLFGSSQNAGNTSNSLFGTKPANVPAATGSSVSQLNSLFNRATRFNDLADDAKKQLEMLDAMIQTQCRHSDALKAMQLGTEISEGTSLLRQVTSEMHTTSASVITASNLLDSVRQNIDGDVADLIKLASIVDVYRAQRTAGGTHNTGEVLPNPINFQYEYFSQKAIEMEERVKTYRQTIDFVELQLKGLFDRPSPASIVPALKAQYHTFMILADKVAQLDTEIRAVKDEYREIWRHQTGSVRDPFSEVDRAFGLCN
ncbi:hypothetical protein O181_062573 [Austropuccinia psidii MF-1]|uniref:Uncharacterized protein n=1 Tax=Austropuccinia psidii MF-1 TaxID=1389203 RepID=A0A9Q3EJX3_9BASI|nr:hypothetical protein [Austropuccinia psidii MF-1]